MTESQRGGDRPSDAIDPENNCNPENPCYSECVAFAAEHNARVSADAPPAPRFREGDRVESLRGAGAGVVEEVFWSERSRMWRVSVKRDNGEAERWLATGGSEDDFVHEPVADPLYEPRVSPDILIDTVTGQVTRQDPTLLAAGDGSAEATHRAQPGDPTVRHVVAWMRATYPQNQHAREWANEIEHVFLRRRHAKEDRPCDAGSAGTADAARYGAPGTSGPIEASASRASFTSEPVRTAGDERPSASPMSASSMSGSSATPLAPSLDAESYTVRRFVLDHCAAIGAEYEADFRKDLLRMLDEVRRHEREHGRERAIPEDGPGSHAWGLHELRTLQAENAKLRAVAEAGQDLVGAVILAALHGWSSRYADRAVTLAERLSLGMPGDSSCDPSDRGGSP